MLLRYALATRIALQALCQYLKRWVNFGCRYWVNVQCLLTDDVSALGGTIAELTNHIQSQGGNIVGVVTLANKSRNGVVGL